jgi:hypothetical protein
MFGFIDADKKININEIYKRMVNINQLDEIIVIGKLSINREFLITVHTES